MPIGRKGAPGEIRLVAVGPDGIHIEAYKFGGHRLTVYLTLFFNSCLRCGYLPKDLMCSVFAPLVKNKAGDL